MPRKTSKLKTRLERMKAIVNKLRNGRFGIYRKTWLFTLSKVITAIPFLVVWCGWVFDWFEMPNTHFAKFYVYEILAGYVVTLIWLHILAYFNLSIAVYTTTYVSLLFALPTFAAAAACAFTTVKKEACYGLIVAALFSTIDGVMSFLRPLPPPPPPRVDPTYQEETPTRFVRRPLEGPPFVYIPLHGGPSVGLDEFPDMADTRHKKGRAAESEASSQLSDTVDYQRKRTKASESQRDLSDDESYERRRNTSHQWNKIRSLLSIFPSLMEQRRQAQETEGEDSVERLDPRTPMQILIKLKNRTKNLGQNIASIVRSTEDDGGNQSSIPDPQVSRNPQ